ncbi:MAG: hypothetical protein LBK60_02350 [Verrucomicrobiales bacterium]|jgi:antitoxin component of RelBE/YafQ-DinJ toxin-antitoxin module|nr:hypothetical protein [Verrucomicrobiales bacterium]
MHTATISIEVTPAIKRAAAANAKKSGIPLPALLSYFVNRLAAEPEAAYEAHYPNEETQAAIRDLENGVGVSTYENIEDLYREVGWEIPKKHAR